MPGGGQIIRTGPGFVTKENAADVIALARRASGEPPRRLGSVVPKWVPRPAAVLVWLVFAVVAGPSFRSLDGTAAVLNAAAPLGILAVAVALLMIGGEFDLSVGSMIGAGRHDDHAAHAALGWSLWPAIAVTVAARLAIGFGNG